jgi:hypothetical protein
VLFLSRLSKFSCSSPQNSTAPLKASLSFASGGKGLATPSLMSSLTDAGLLDKLPRHSSPRFWCSNQLLREGTGGGEDRTGGGEDRTGTDERARAPGNGASSAAEERTSSPEWQNAAGGSGGGGVTTVVSPRSDSATSLTPPQGRTPGGAGPLGMCPFNGYKPASYFRGQVAIPVHIFLPELGSPAHFQRTGELR